MTVSDASGEIDINEDGSLSRMPSGDLTYESDPFGTATTAIIISGVMTAADTDEGLEVTISSSGSSTTENGISSSGGGCNAGLGLWALSALIVFATLKQRR